jgi:uncharacterized protein (DUF302 family)
MLALSLLFPAVALAEERAAITPYDGSFEDATFAVESAILGAGLVIDHVSHTGEMLERTRGDVGSDVVLFGAADIYLFCSASVSRQVMEADPLNIAFCPYSIFVTEKDGEVQVGHQLYAPESMNPVEDLLSSIVAEAVSF